MTFQNRFLYRGPVSLVALGLVLVCSGCVNLAQKDTKSPGWFSPENRRAHDTKHLYFTAKGESESSLQQSRQNALKAIQAEIAKYIFTEVRVKESDTKTTVSLESAIELREVEIFREDHARRGRQWVVWMLGRYPRTEYNRIRERLEAGVVLENQWKKAQSEINRNQFKNGEKTLIDIIHAYDKALRVSFDLEAVKLELASSYLKRNHGLKARQWITDVQKTTVSPDWRRRADRLADQVPPISLGDAFGGHTVGVYCCVRRDGLLAMDSGLTQVLGNRLTQHGARTVSSRMSLLKDDNTIDDETLKSVTDILRAKSADVVFLLLLDVDSRKTGKKIEIPGSNAQADALDARMTYWILRASDAQLLASDGTAGFSHAPVGMLNTILTHQRHLPSHAAAIAEGLEAK